MGGHRVVVGTKAAYDSLSEDGAETAKWRSCFNYKGTHHSIRVAMALNDIAMNPFSPRLSIYLRD